MSVNQANGKSFTYNHALREALQRAARDEIDFLCDVLDTSATANIEEAAEWLTLIQSEYVLQIARSLQISYEGSLQDDTVAVSETPDPVSILHQLRGQIKHLIAERGVEQDNLAVQYPTDICPSYLICLPKSGSNWLANMLAALPGYNRLRQDHIRAAKLQAQPWLEQRYDLRSEFHKFRFDPVVMQQMDGQAGIAKTHGFATPLNLHYLHQSGKKYLVLYRDVRDIAVSWYYFMRNERSSPERYLLREMNESQGIDYFVEHKLDYYCSWIETWRAKRHPELSIEVTYEQLKADTLGTLRRVVDFLGLQADEAHLQAIVEANSFQAQSGRKAGEEDTSSKLRKGKVGDWEERFTSQQAERLLQRAGGLLRDLGYED